MKKLFAVMTATLALCLMTAASAEEAVQTARYDLVNLTGENVTELYFYKADDEDKGANLAEEALLPDESIELTFEAPVEQDVSGYNFVLDFTTESGYNAKFETVHFEEVSLNMLSADAMTGATPISFSPILLKAHYVVTNNTGADVTELYFYEAGSEDKGENLAEGGLAAGESVEINLKAASEEEAKAANYCLEFVGEDGVSRKFETVHFEDVVVELLAADAITGATPIRFAPLPEK